MHVQPSLELTHMLKMLGVLFALTLTTTGIAHAQADSDFRTLRDLNEDPAPSTMTTPQSAFTPPPSRPSVTPTLTQASAVIKPPAPQGVRSALWFCYRPTDARRDFQFCTGDHQIVGGRPVRLANPRYRYYTLDGQSVTADQVRAGMRAYDVATRPQPVYDDARRYESEDYYDRGYDYPSYRSRRDSPLAFFDVPRDYCNTVPDRPGGGGEERRRCPLPSWMR